MDGKKGLVMLFTGEGKGKTTAALGAAMRAVGHGTRVYMIQFMKGRLYGEIAASRKLEGLTIEQHGRDEFVDPNNPDPVDTELALRGWARVLGIVEKENPGMVILDEINVAVAFGLIPEETVAEFIRNRPSHLDLILTGRYAPEGFFALADTVTEMVEIKHHYNAGVEMRKGIEY